MSFTATVKDEVSKLDIPETEKISELSAIVQNNDYSNKSQGIDNRQPRNNKNVHI